jgi:hypothetical protein
VGAAVEFPPAELPPAQPAIKDASSASVPKVIIHRDGFIFFSSLNV